MKKLSNIMDGTIKWVVYGLLALIVIFLTVASLFGSCYVNHDEYTYFLSDTGYKHVAAFVLVVAFALLYRKFVNSKLTEWHKKVLWYGLLGIYGIVMACITLYVSMEPRADQASVVNTALAMVNEDYTAYEVGGYMSVYPNQVGIVYFFYWLFKIFPFGYKTVCVLNVMSLIGIMIGMAGIGSLYGKNNKYLTGVVTMLFFPITCYATFIYGNLMGQALSTLGIYFAMKYFSQRKTSSIVWSVTTCALAVVIKENFLIPLIGVVLFLLLDLVKSPKKKSAFFLLGLLSATICFSNGVKLHTEQITEKKISTGVPTLAWVAMGMQEGYMAYGWHNQYNEDVYRANDCNTEQTNAQVKEDLVVRMKEFLSNPAYTVKFFYQKTLSQWNNPTFECFWINDLTKRQSDGIEVKNVAGVFKSVLGEPGNPLLREYCNLYQTLILAGVCIWIFWGRKELKVEQLLLATIFVGGFVFHFFWEAKCQYVMPYFVLLIPYAIKGYQYLLGALEQIHSNQKEKLYMKIVKNRCLSLILLVGFLVVVISLAGTKFVDKAFGFSNQQYEEYYDTSVAIRRYHYSSSKV